MGVSVAVGGVDDCHRHRIPELSALSRSRAAVGTVVDVRSDHPEFDGGAVPEQSFGVQCFDGRAGTAASPIQVSAPHCLVVDTVGAGDALVAGLLEGLLGSGHIAGPIKASPSELRRWCQQATEATRAVLGAVGARGHLGGNLVRLDDPAPGMCRVCGGPQSTRVTPVTGSAGRAFAASVENY
ncbi:PfkB family carbohydrate kinase (plasmid) [Nocardia sp. NBC_01377]